jgi:AcrR family transcriptional regulator
MSPSAGAPGRPAGLRERKKARTRSEIQRQALRLFREQGFHATTVEQIAEAAEVAPSTVFRYFPRKEDLAVLDGYHSLQDAIVTAFRSQPTELTALAALRAALRTAFAALDPADLAARQGRDLGMVQVPELWSANIPTVLRSLDVIAGLVAERAGRRVDDPAVRSLTAAVFGIGLDVLLRRGPEPGTDLAAALDDALARLDTAVAL